MNYRNHFLFYFLLTVFLNQAPAANITIHKKNAVVWSQLQTISGSVDTLVTQGTLFLNNQPLSFNINTADLSFSVPVMLAEGVNEIYIIIDNPDNSLLSDTLRLTLGYQLKPHLSAEAEVSGRIVTLKGRVIDNPRHQLLDFSWQEDPYNPLNFQISGSADSVISFTVPDRSPEGEYYFNFYAVSSESDSSRARVCFIIEDDTLRRFNIKTDHANWIDQAVIYQVTPYNFTANGNFEKVRRKIAELADLAINTLYLQPVYTTWGGGQGYDIIDYFQIRQDYGSEADLKALISEAKAHGMHVLFDFVPGHSSIHHPYAQQTVRDGAESHYYNFYKREFDDAPYSQHYHLHPDGFLYYFWTDLPMYDYNNPEVQRWMIEAALYWVEKFDIDGYRVDAVWGVNARNPEFSRKLRLALKQYKPEFFLLAEDKATWPSVFEESYDAAYDWTPEESWVSHWSWQTAYNPDANPTIFNHPNQHQRAFLLKQALTNDGDGYHPGAVILRFLENNDTQRFIKHHGLKPTKMAASLLFSLDGVPMIYNGQEIGFDVHPYQTFNIFTSGSSIASQDAYGLYPWYKELIRLRKVHPALYSRNYQQLTVRPGSYMFAYRRWFNRENIISVLNLGNFSIDAEIDLPLEELQLDSATVYYLTDLLSSEIFSGMPSELSTVTVHFEPYLARLFLLADTISAVNHLADQKTINAATFALDQNYPNPFNPVTTIEYQLPERSWIKIEIFNIIGQRVESLFEGLQRAGRHRIELDGSRLASGVYIYRLQFKNQSLSRKMILLK